MPWRSAPVSFCPCDKAKGITVGGADLKEPWPAVAVVGAGAVGCYFGAMLARAGAPVTLIGRPAQVDALNRHGLLVDSVTFQETVRIAATADPGAVRQAQLVLFSVKATDTEPAARSIAPHLSPASKVLCLQNGVDNAERFREVAGHDAAPAVVYVAVEVTAPGRIRHTGRGDLVIEDRSLAGWFERAGIPCRVSGDIRVDLWTKLIMNCAYNAISALTRARYGAIAADPGTRELMDQVIAECGAVARAAGIRLPALRDDVFRLAAAMPQALSSTAQDLLRGKRTEIDSLNGYVARQGARLGVPATINQALYAMVKVAEQASA